MPEINMAGLLFLIPNSKKISTIELLVSEGADIGDLFEKYLSLLFATNDGEGFRPKDDKRLDRSISTLLT